MNLKQNVSWNLQNMKGTTLVDIEQNSEKVQFFSLDLNEEVRPEK